MRVKDMVKQSQINWAKASDSIPAFKKQGQTKFSWENYYRLVKEAKDYDNQDVELNEVKG